MPKKPTGNPPGRPRKDDAAQAVAEEAARTGAPVGEVARKRGVGRSTAYRAKAAPRPAAAPARKPSPPGKPAPTGATPLERLRAYAAGDPEALAALEQLLQPPEEGLGRDELQALRDGLVLAAQLVREAAASREGGEEADDGRLLRALQRLEGLGKTVATVKAKRPPEDGPDEATRRLVAVRDRAIERIGLLTSATAGKFAADRKALDAWLGTLGTFGAEVRGRVDEMLGGRR